ncbi:MAG: CoB--CoM heterodisulfide reductase iron-sulfur subunit B family protein [Spirochaetes bacterium]|nr:CoB--CoM heterodisulfide reductase iron-sulfur subunit B family protein [Spirochaetota bacterium]
MEVVSYMPGCTLKTSGRNFEKSAITLFDILGVTMEELDRWVCCGTTYSLSSDNIMNQLAPVRTLLRAKETGRRELLVLCSMCYNTLRRAQSLVLHDKEKRDKINEFMYREKTTFDGDEIRVVHLLNYLKDSVGFERVAKRVVKKPSDLKIALYYGCMLLRPHEVSVDESSEDPTIMEELFSLCGVTPVYFPFKTECCGSYQTVNQRDMVLSRAERIVGSAAKNGADMIVVSCPLCCHNLDSSQQRVADTVRGFRKIPVMYISQLLALLVGADDAGDYRLHSVDPRPVLKEKGLIG